jgi:hypothetical protein
MKRHKPTRQLECDLKKKYIDGRPQKDSKGAYLVRHPGALDFEIPASDSANERRQIRLRVYHLDDVGC